VMLPELDDGEEVLYLFRITYLGPCIIQDISVDKCRVMSLQ
jgi:hypothetical protein